MAGTSTSHTRNPGMVTITGNKWETGNKAREGQPPSKCVMGYRGQFWDVCLYSLPVFEVCFYGASRVIGACGRLRHVKVPRTFKALVDLT